MRSKLKWFVPLFIVTGLTVLYLLPTSIVPFDQLYAKVEPSIVDSLQSFRRDNPPRQIQDDGASWEYIALGEGKDTIVFLHGMTGAYDIWWQQINDLKGQYRIISVTYPPVQSLAALEKGVLAILEKEGIKEFNAVGTSLGGYFAQYLIGKHPKRIRRVVLSNTFPPNDLIAEKNRTLGSILPLLPEWIVMSVFRGNFEKTIYPTSGNNELTLAFLNEIGYGRMRKAHLIGRYYCVIEKFSVAAPAIPVMIIESDNDPLVESILREQLKAEYPNTAVHTFSREGHFPYLNRPKEYTRLLSDFLSKL